MKRVLKFRAWYKKESILAYDDQQVVFDVEYWDGVLSSKIGMLNHIAKDEDIEIMQYTGLKDKNGVEIYEGDIGEIRTQSGRVERFVVQWGIHRRHMASGWDVDIPSFAFMIDGKPTFPIAENYLNGHDLDIITIIGNIYQHPNLLNAATA